MGKMVSPGRLAAAVGISAAVTAGFGWPEVLLGWCLGLILAWMLGPMKARAPRSLLGRLLLLLGGVILAAAAATAAEQAFPQDGTFPMVSLGVMLLLYRALLGTERGNRGAANVMGMLVLVMIAAAEAAGIGNIRWRNLRPVGSRVEQVLITAAVGCVFLGTGWEKQSLGWQLGAAALCTGMSLVTRGILGPYLTESLELPMYRAMENIRVFGMTQRMEAFLSAAIVMGAFGLMLLAGGWIRRSGVIPKAGKGRIWGNAAAVIGIYLIEWWYRGAQTECRGWMKAVFWGILAITALGIVICEKNEKRC